MKRLFFVTDKEGEQALSWMRAALGLISAALVTVLISWFIWVTTQAYDVATNKTLIRDTGVRLEKSIDINRQDIILNNGEVEDTLNSLKTKLDARFDRVNGILHGRVTKVDDKYDAKMDQLQKLLMDTNRLVVEMLIQKNKDIQLQKKEIALEKEKVEMQQQIQQKQKIAPKWPVSPANGD